MNDKRKKRDANLRTRYRIGQAEFETLLQAQGGRCTGCLRPATALTRTLCVDHCHETGVIRGLLCLECNSALSNVRDNVSILHRLADYVEHHARINNALISPPHITLGVRQT